MMFVASGDENGVRLKASQPKAQAHSHDTIYLVNERFL